MKRNETPIATALILNQTIIDKPPSRKIKNTVESRTASSEADPRGRALNHEYIFHYKDLVQTTKRLQ